MKWASITNITRNNSNISIYVVLLAGLCLLAGTVVRLTIVQPLTNEPMVFSLFADDGFYYLEIARNVVKLGSFTFDGINHTNGFHPLWQLLLSVLALYSSDDFVFMRVVMYFSIALFLITGIHLVLRGLLWSQVQMCIIINTLSFA